MKIAIVDDEVSFRRELIGYFKKYFSGGEVNYEIKTFADGEDFLKSNEKFDLVLFDIEMPKTDGMSAAKILRKKDEDVIIVFVTQMAKYALDGYEVGAFAYVVKPVEYYDFKMKIGRAVNKVIAKKGRRIIIKNKSESEYVGAADVIYVEVANRSIVYHTRGQKITTYGSLKEVEKDFAGLPFARCNNCYLVNLDFVQGVKGLTLILKNGETLQISSPRRKAFLGALTDYIGG